MSFFFKKDKDKSKPGSSQGNALPQVSRDIRSSDGVPGSSSSQIPTLNGAISAPKPASPSPGASVNNSLNSVSGADGLRPGTASGGSVRAPQPEEKITQAIDPAKPPSPEQKSMRDPNMRNGGQERIQEPVCSIRRYGEYTIFWS